MPWRTSRVRLRVTEIHAPAAALRHSSCRLAAHLGAPFPGEYCARTLIRPADSSDPQECRRRCLPELLHMQLAWASPDQVGLKVVRPSSLHCPPHPDAIERL